MRKKVISILIIGFIIFLYGILEADRGASLSIVAESIDKIDVFDQTGEDENKNKDETGYQGDKLSMTDAEATISVSNDTFTLKAKFMTYFPDTGRLIAKNATLTNSSSEIRAQGEEIVLMLKKPKHSSKK